MNNNQNKCINNNVNDLDIKKQSKFFILTNKLKKAIIIWLTFNI